MQPSYFFEFLVEVDLLLEVVLLPLWQSLVIVHADAKHLLEVLLTQVCLQSN